jgi:hypothetical protein
MHYASRRAAPRRAARGKNRSKWERRSWIERSARVSRDDDYTIGDKKIIPPTCLGLFTDALSQREDKFPSACDSDAE